MIDVDELERQAKLTSGDNFVRVHRDELVFLINRYREVPDLSEEERSHHDQFPPNTDQRTPEGWRDFAHRLEGQLVKTKERLESQRYNFALFARCPFCGAEPGKACQVSGHEQRISAAFEALHKLRGSMFGESV
jgi:hypothetical protein